ncbi:MAG TPA: META domain-containing protein, partial [Vicinamibacterales bacterium]
MGRGLALIMLSHSPVPAFAAEPMICFGNEPSWSLRLVDPGIGRFSTPDGPSVDYQGSETRMDPLAEQIWRGKPKTGESGDLVAFLSQTDCSDGMSDKTHPITARVSLADHRALAGCCRIVSTDAALPSAAAAIEGPTWRLTALRGLDAKALRAGDEPVTARFQDGRVSGFSGCNRFFGGYVLEGDQV